MVEKLAVQKHNHTSCVNGLCGRILLEFQFSYLEAGKLLILCL